MRHYPEVHLNYTYIKHHLPPQRTKALSIRMINHLTLFKGINIQFQSYETHKYSAFEMQNLIMLQQFTYSYHWALVCWNILGLSRNGRLAHQTYWTEPRELQASQVFLVRFHSFSASEVVMAAFIWHNLLRIFSQFTFLIFFKKNRIS